MPRGRIRSRQLRVVMLLICVLFLQTTPRFCSAARLADPKVLGCADFEGAHLGFGSAANPGTVKPSPGLGEQRNALVISGSNGPTGVGGLKLELGSIPDVNESAVLTMKVSVITLDGSTADRHVVVAGMTFPVSTPPIKVQFYKPTGVSVITPYVNGLSPGDEKALKTPIAVAITLTRTSLDFFAYSVSIDNKTLYSTNVGAKAGPFKIGVGATLEGGDDAAEVAIDDILVMRAP
jgi:hypothetical protein